MGTYERVVAPGRIGPLQLPNRVIMPAMGTGMATPEGYISDRLIAFHAERARGGTGLVVVENAAVCIDYEHADGLRADSDDVLATMRRLTDSVHAAGGRVGIQLTPGIGRNSPSFTADRPPVSASDNASFFDPTVRCRPLETSEVNHIIECFEAAANRCQRAGFDHIDIHGHTGYLVDQFLAPQWNRRTDQYGGSLENRARFAVELVRAAKRGAPGLSVSFRLSVDNRFPGGKPADEAPQVARLLEAAGLDLLMADDGSYEAMDYVFPPYYHGDGSMLSAARVLKSAVSIPVMAVGNLDPDTAERTMEAGDADFIGIGRGLIAEPQWVRKLTEGRAVDLRPCIRCNQLCVGNVLAGMPLSCAVNPQAGFETERVITPAETPRHVVVVGGGPAGLEAARVAGLRGHRVDLYEKEGHLGGVLWPAASPDFKHQLRSMIDWWKHQLEPLSVTVHLNTEVNAGDAELEAAEAVVVATGSTPVHPRGIEGLDGDRVVDVIDAHLGTPLGRRVLIAGGGLSGADLALELARAGHTVTIVEQAPAIATDMLPGNLLSLLRELTAAGVRILTSHTVVAVDDTDVTVRTSGGARHLEADSVVLALGVRPAAELAAELSGSPNVYPVGDCVRPAKVGEAINAAFLAGLAV